MEYNIERSSSVSMFKKQRKLDDGKVVWDSVVKLRKKNPALCSKYPKKHLGIRNNWIREFSNTLSEKASSYVLETMSTERTNRQEEIAETLLNRFNAFLEQQASLKDPQTLTHKAMAVVADKLSLWLDKNVKVSKNVGVRIRQMEEEEKQKRLIEEILRLEKERKDRDNEKMQKLVEPKSAHDIMRPHPETAPESKPPEEEEEEDHPAMDPETDKNELQEADEDHKPPRNDDIPLDDESRDAPQAEDQFLQPPPSTRDLADQTPADIGLAEDEVKDTQEDTEDSTGINEEETEGINDNDQKPDREGQQVAESKVPSDDAETRNEVPVEDGAGTLKPSSEEGFAEPEIPDGSPIQTILGVGGEQSAGATEDSTISNRDALEVTETPLDTVGDEGDVTSPLDTVGDEGDVTFEETKPADDNIQYSSSDTSYRDDINTEHSDGSATLVEELLSMDEKDKDLADDEELIDLNDNGRSADDKTDAVLNALAEMIARTSEEHSPLQEAIKDIMEKELEMRLGDKDVEIINEVAGKVGTWMDKMVDRASAEYGERRSPSRARSMSPRAVSFPKDSIGVPGQPLEPLAGLPPAMEPVAPLASLPPAMALQPKAPEGLAESFYETTRIPSPHPPVSQKPKGPIFQLRKVDTKNIFNVAGVTHTKAKRKIQAARGQSSSRRISQESLDLEEWAEWAGLVSDVSRNWAKWVEDVARGGERRNNDKRLCSDAKEWKSITKELQREGDIWTKKVMRKQSKQKSGGTSKPDVVSA